MIVRQSDLSLRISDVHISGGTLLLLLIGAASVAGAVVVRVPPMVLYGGLVAVATAVFCVRRPYQGLLLYMCLEYLRPSERFPALAPFHLTRVVALVMLVGWMLRRKREGYTTWVRGPESTALLVMFVVALASIPGAFWKQQAANTAIDFGRTLLVCIAITNIVNTPRRLNGFMLTFILANVFLSGEQLWQYLTHGQPTGEIVRVGSSSGSFLGEDGDFAMAIGVAAPFVYFLMWSGIRPLLRGLCLAAMLMFVASVVATGSRGGTLAFVSVLLVLVLRSRRTVVALALVAVVVFTAWTVSPPSYKARMRSIVESGSADPTAQTRINSWRTARLMFTDRPFLGVGAGNFYEAFVQHYGGSYRSTQTVHSVYYQAAAELGMCGLMAFFFLVCTVLVRSMSLSVRLVGAGLAVTPVAAYAAAVLPATVAFAVGGAFQTPLYYPHVYMLAALTLSMHTISRDIIPGTGEKETRSRWKRTQARLGLART